MKLNSILICPTCSSVLPTEALTCSCSPSQSLFYKKVYLASSIEGQSYFDELYKTMIEGNSEAGTQSIFYNDQIEFFLNTIKSGEVILDIGCGPKLAYTHPKDTFLIGLDPSLASITANYQVDLGIFGTASKIPLVERSVDRVVCFYSIHHMTAESVASNRSILANVFNELGRVIKHSGEIMIFDVSPIFPFNLAEDIIWNTAKKSLGTKLDMYFWKDDYLKRLGLSAFPGAQFSQKSFHSNWSTKFAPIFSKPDFFIPRLFYPFNVNLYSWKCF
jgi:SAM-dependent methyltransferase